MPIQYNGPSYRHQWSNLSGEGNAIQSSSRIIKKAKSPILGAKWISHLAPQFSISKIEKNSTSQCPKGVLENTLVFLFGTFFTVYENWWWDLVTEVKFLCIKRETHKIIVMADTFGWFNTFLIHLLRNCHGKNFKYIKYILSAYSQENCDYPER